MRDIKPSSGLHSIYEELEHMRLAQQDLLYFAPARRMGITGLARGLLA